LARTVAVIPGDGIGPEIIGATLRVLEALGADLDLVTVRAGLEEYKRTGRPISEEAMETIRRSDAVLKGPIATPAGPGTYRSVNVMLRQELGLFANVRYFEHYEGISLVGDFDVVLYRENTEGLYRGLEFRVGDAALGIRVINREGSERILRAAFEAARARRRRLAVVHKANILKETCGLFVRTAEELSKKYPDVDVEYITVDAAAYKLLKSTRDFDVIVTANMFGDILSDELAGIVGSIGLVPSVNMGGGPPVFEAIHGAAFDIAGRGVANPAGLMLSAALMLEWLGYGRLGTELRRSVKDCIASGLRTPDLGGNLGTMGFADAVLRNLKT